MPRPHPCLAPPPAPIAPHHLSTAPLPPAPIGLASSASRPSRAVARIASTPLRADIRVTLCRHRADSVLIAPPSRPSCAAAVLHVLRFAVRIAPTACRHPRHPLALRRPRGPSWQESHRMHPPFRRMREKGPLPGNIRPKCMLFEIKMATSSPHASISGRNRAIQDTWRANLAAKGPFPRRGARNHAWREDVASAARPFRGSGMRSGRTGFAPCDSDMRSDRTGFVPCGSGMRHAAWPNGLCALRRGPGLLAACAPLSSRLCPPRPAVRPDGLRRPRPATRSPYRCISLPARCTHPASRADPPRPGNKQNNANNSMRA